MTGSTQNERVHRSSRLTAYFKRRFKKHNRQDSPSLSPKAAASPAGSAASSIPPATFQETYAAINTGPTSTTATGALFATATGAVLATATDTLAESRTDIIEESTTSDLWSRAYQELDEKTKKWIAEASKKDGGEEQAQDLIKIVREREAVYKDATPKLKIGDKEILWRDYANNVVAWVTTIGDISINFAPAPSPVVWSAVKVLLKANVSQCEDLAAIFGCAEKVLRLIRHGKVYEEVYLSDGSCSMAAKNLQDALVDLYKSLMELLAHTFTRLNEGQGKQFLRALISGGEGAQLISALADQERNVSMAAQGCGAVASQEHQKLLQALDEPLRNVEDSVKKLLEKIEDGTLQQALDYISTIPIGEHQMEKREARTPKTCEWLLSHYRYLNWEKSRRSSILWLQGSVGAGKSFLTSKVIDYSIAASQQKAENDEGLAYFYCSRSDPVRRETKHILRSYISQLARVPNYPTMMEKNIYALYLKAKKEKRGFSTEECEMALMELLNLYPRTTLILDALDECEMDARENIARIFRNLVNKGEGTVKVFIASRKEADIEEYLGSQKLVKISTADNRNDIGKYIDAEIKKVGGAWRAVSADVEEQVKKTIREKSDGMFRWAYLQWQQLKKLRTNERIIERLGRLPESLSEAYDEIYSQNEEKIVLQRAVKWVLCAREPLTSEVLLAAVRLESSLLSLTLSDPIDESTLEDICSHLVVLDSQLKVWSFPHASVAEYFEDRHKSWIDKAPEDVAIQLISCLMGCYTEWTLTGTNAETLEFLESTPDLTNHLDPRHPLQKHTRKYWLKHLQNTPDQYQEATGLSEILKRFLGTQGPQGLSSRQYQAWCKHMRLLRFHHSYGYHKDIQPSEKSIFGICTLGLHKLLKGWWDEDIDVSQVNQWGLDLLAIAARYGHDELCSELIDLGSDVNRELDTGLGSALMEAIFGKHITTARLLLDRGADPNVTRNGKSPLCLAAELAELAEEFAKLLLEAGADPNFTCSRCYYGCALEAASYHGKADLAELLIKNGATVNLKVEGSRYGSPLGAAAYAGSLKCAELLVENGADVNAHLSGKYGSALAAAIISGKSFQVVKYLIEEAGADPAILSSSPPPIRWPHINRYTDDDRRRIVHYLLYEGHVQRNVLLSMKFARRDLPVDPGAKTKSRWTSESEATSEREAISESEATTSSVATIDIEDESTWY